MIQFGTDKSFETTLYVNVDADLAPSLPLSSSALLNWSAPHPAFTPPAPCSLSSKNPTTNQPCNNSFPHHKPDNAVATTAKMVQSAILGFPRMGVNRDLKKATEACKLPKQSR